MQHAAFGVHLVEFYSASLRHAQAMTEHEKQQATVADFVPSALGRFNQAFNLARREMLPLANLCQHPPPVFRAEVRPRAEPSVFPFLACLSFCREFTLSDAPETRMNRGGDFSAMNKRDHFVELVDETGGSMCRF